ncbi:hypothetical protein ACLB2K_047561 [Fragaria x ananassa]
MTSSGEGESKERSFRAPIGFTRFRSRRPEKLAVVASPRPVEHFCGLGSQREARRRENRRREVSEFFGESSKFSGELWFLHKKTALMLALCKFWHDKYNLAAVTNDIFTKEDGEFLVKPGAILEERIRVVETGGCPHATIREDININLGPLEELSNMYKAYTLLCELGGGTLWRQLNENP